MIGDVLPKGWVYTKIEDVSVKCEQRTPLDNEEFVYVDIGSIDREAKKIVEPQTLLGDKAPSRARKIINVGDVLVSLTRPNLNAVAQISGVLDNQIASTGFEVIKPLIVDGRYIFALVKSKGFIDAISGKVQGALYPAAKSSDVRSYAFPLPPLAEQKQIASKLDQLLSQVNTLKTRLDNIPIILKRFRQSVLAAAVSGKLTEEWREKHDISLDSWQNKKVGDLVDAIEAGKNLKCIETPPKDNECGIIKISAVTWGVYNEDESKTLPDNKLFIESRRIQLGDFLISRANTIELLGNLVIVHEVTKNLMLSDKVLRLVMAEEDKPWVSMFLRSHRGRREIESRSTGNQMSMRNIGQRALLDINIPKATADEQTEIVSRVEQLFTFADKIEKQVKDAQVRVNNLTQSILAKSFRGDLTAEWREQNLNLISGENSAETLLEKIKAERDMKTPTKKKRKARA